MILYITNGPNKRIHLDAYSATIGKRGALRQGESVEVTGQSQVLGEEQQGVRQRVRDGNG